MAALALAGVLLSACGGGQADKAGGVPKPVVLRLGDPYGPLPGDDTRYFVAQVERLSGGSLRLRHVPEVAGSAGGPGEREWRTAKLVRAGKVDLATLAARTWDLEGVTSLEALQAPMLVTSQAVLNRIVTGQIGDQMLRGLTKIGVTGLVLLPQALYHPFGLGRELTAPNDFAGVRIRTGLSKVNFAVLRMLGARPFEEKSWRTFVSSASKENFGGALDELRNWPVGSAEQWSATANITFFAKVNMLVVNSEVFANLSEKQRDVLRRAAADTQRYVICTNSPEDKAAARICAEGVEITNSSRRDLAAFEHATQPIYSVLDKDPLTRHLIAVIRGLKHETTPTAVAACDKSKGTQERSSSRRFDPIPDGIYRLEFSTRELIAAHAVADPVAAQNAAREDAGIWTLTIRRGSWKLINKVIPM